MGQTLCGGTALRANDFSAKPSPDLDLMESLTGRDTLNR